VPNVPRADAIDISALLKSAHTRVACTCASVSVTKNNTRTAAPHYIEHEQGAQEVGAPSKEAAACLEAFCMSLRFWFVVLIDFAANKIKNSLIN
jgi:hypothetical protein